MKFLNNTVQNEQDLWEKLLYAENNVVKRLLICTSIAAISTFITALIYNYTGGYFHSVIILTILIISLVGGFLEGIIYSVILSLINDFFIIPPIGSVLESPESVEHLAINVIIGTFVAAIIAALRSSYKRVLKAKQEAEAAKQEAEAANRLKTNFLATISHEIRTPLNGIIGLSDVLRKMNLNEEEFRFTEHIHSSGKTLLKIINDILDYSKLESGKTEFETSEFSVEDVVEQVTSTLSLKAIEKGIHLDFLIDENVPKKLFGDASRVLQILYNLTGNAIKFTAMGSVVIKIKLDSNQRGQSKRVIFSVTDTGVGLSLSEQKKLFQPFTQIQKAGTSDEAGTGLGLSICRQILRAMGSEIHVESKKDHGARFYFTLEFTQFSKEKIGPQKEINKLTPVTRPAEIKPLFNKDENPPTILVVEDNPTNQITVQAMLEKMGVQVILASNGIESLDLISKSEVDLIFMDCQMPIMDGFEATNKLRQSRITTPIVAMTANVAKEDQEACRAAGMNGFISKPISIEILKVEVIRFLKPEPVRIETEVIDKLENAIGASGKNKVIQAFIKSLGEMHEMMSLAESEKNLEKIHKIGHRYKSSADTVGAVGLAYLFKNLEKVSQLETASILIAQINFSVVEVESKLNQHILA